MRSDILSLLNRFILENWNEMGVAYGLGFSEF
jgi:hypothetical protein